MTKDQIERYGGICDKIVALRSLKVRDTVQGSSSEIPYQKHTIVLEGGIAEGKNSKLQALKRQKAAIEAAVEAIEDETDQAVISMRMHKSADTTAKILELEHIISDLRGHMEWHKRRVAHESE